ncbi:carbohydrate ABC transporter permease [Bradyrhizobium sp. RDM4]|uniref:carbohydrate ABC transporter permease n=1 Tax=Bradyrhizobium sp. RDM4 TaxID=3378765 RepID=UPI0038FC8D06
MRKTPAERLLSPLTIGVLVAVVVGPMAWALVTSLKTEANVITFPPSLLPSPATLASYVAVFRQQNFVIELLNSVFYATASIALTLAVSVPAGYAASRLTFPGKRAVMLLILATSMIPGVALLIPTYFVLDAIGLLNNPVAIIVLQAARLVPQTIWFMQNFVDAVPIELDEATEVDGATRWQTFAQVILPLIKPGIAAAAVLGVITTWNDYITVAAFAPDVARRTLQVALVNQVFDSIGVTWSYVMAFAIVSSIPMVALFIVAQRWFIAGLTAGAVKG